VIEAWPAWDVATVLSRPVAPGEIARFAFEVKAPDAPGAVIEESFQLMEAGGPLIACPRADLTVKTRVLPANPSASDEAASGAGGASEGDIPALRHSRVGCSFSAGDTGRGPWSAGLALAALLLRRKRRHGAPTRGV
jgi:MYXO-CTERM domain-containing protein